jgi:hypothetical protein
MKPTRTKSQARWNKRKLSHWKANVQRAAAIAAEPSDEQKIRAIDPDATFILASKCPGLKEDYVYADYDTGSKVARFEGPVRWVARMLHFAGIDYDAMDREDERERARLKDFFKTLDKR